MNEFIQQISYKDDSEILIGWWRQVSHGALDAQYTSVFTTLCSGMQERSVLLTSQSKLADDTISQLKSDMDQVEGKFAQCQETLTRALTTHQEGTSRLEVKIADVQSAHDKLADELGELRSQNTGLASFSATNILSWQQVHGNRDCSRLGLAALKEVG